MGLLLRRVRVAIRWCSDLSGQFLQPVALLPDIDEQRKNLKLLHRVSPATCFTFYFYWSYTMSVKTLLTSAAATAAIVGTIGFAYAQTESTTRNPDGTVRDITQPSGTTGNRATTPSTSPSETINNSTGTTPNTAGSVNSTGTTTDSSRSMPNSTDTMSNNRNTMNSERTARADRN